MWKYEKIGTHAITGPQNCAEFLFGLGGAILYDRTIITNKLKICKKKKTYFYIVALWVPYSNCVEFNSETNT